MMGPATGNADKKKSLATHSCRHQKALQNEQKKSFATVFCSQFPVVEKSSRARLFATALQDAVN